MTVRHPLSALLGAALGAGAPMSATALSLAFAQATGGSLDHTMALYARPELNAELAGLLWARYAVGPAGRAELHPRVSAQWHARRAMRAEHHPGDLTGPDVAAWPAHLAEQVAHLRDAPGSVVPDAVFVHLMSRPELGIALRAALACPTRQQARDIVSRVGALGGSAWPGMSLPAPGPRPDRKASREPLGARTNGRDIRDALTLVGSRSTPVALVEHAATCWDSPACLSVLPTGALSAAAAGRVATLWLLPAIAGRVLSARELATASMQILPALERGGVVALAGAWLDGALADGLCGNDHVTLSVAFEVAGVPLIRAVTDELVGPLNGMDAGRRLELFTALEAGGVATAGLWDTLGPALPGAASLPLTWGQLLEALASVHSAPGLT